MAGQLPACVLCARRRMTNVQREARSANSGVPVAAFLVTVGQSQIERFECATCQQETQNRIKYVLEEEAR